MYRLHVGWKNFPVYGDICRAAGCFRASAHVVSASIGTVAFWSEREGEKTTSDRLKAGNRRLDNNTGNRLLLHSRERRRGGGGKKR